MTTRTTERSDEPAATTNPGATGSFVAGNRVVQDAVRGHAGTIRRYFLDSLTPEQATTVRAWSEQLIDRVESPS